MMHIQVWAEISTYQRRKCLLGMGDGVWDEYDEEGLESGVGTQGMKALYYGPNIWVCDSGAGGAGSYQPLSPLPLDCPI